MRYVKHMQQLCSLCQCLSIKPGELSLCLSQHFHQVEANLSLFEQLVSLGKHYTLKEVCKLSTQAQVKQKQPPTPSPPCLNNYTFTYRLRQSELVKKKKVELWPLGKRVGGGGHYSRLREWLLLATQSTKQPRSQRKRLQLNICINSQ